MITDIKIKENTQTVYTQFNGEVYTENNIFTDTISSNLITIKFEKVSYEQFKKDIYLYLGEYVYSEDEIKKIYKDIQLPRRATAGSAGYDFYMPLPHAYFDNHTSYIIPTGIKASIPYGYVLSLYPRSSYGYNYGMRLANTVGIIDSDYYNNPDNEGHITVKPKVESPVTIKKGDRFVQGVFLAYAITIDDNPINKDRLGGTGSSGM